MNSFVFIALFAALAVANAGILPAAYSAYSAGPYLSAPVVSAYSAPLVSSGLVGHQTVVAGPSGTIATGRTFAAPGLAAYGAPLVSSYAAPAVLGRTIW